MRFTQRILYKSAAATGIQDCSNQLNDFRALTFPMPYELGDFVYIASEVPFNNVWVDQSVPNELAAKPTVEVWWAHGWHSAVDLLDETEGASGNSMGIDGRISFSPDYLKGWDCEQYAKDVTGLDTTVQINNMYWLRLKWDATLTAGTTLEYIGQKFSSDSDLYEFYPDLNNANLKRAFEVNKTSWELQAYIAAEHIIKDLISRHIIKSRGQVLDWYMMREPSCHKVAELIYQGLGLSFREAKQDAISNYKKSMNIDLFRVDKNNNARLDPIEKRESTTHMGR